MEDFQTRTKQQKKIETIADMKSFIETYPQFRKMSGTVTKHVTLIDEISRMVNEHNLLEISEAEQEIISKEAHSEAFRKVSSLINHAKVRDQDAIRLALIYALTFQANSNLDIRTMVRLLERRGVTQGEAKVMMLSQECGC